MKVTNIEKLKEKILRSRDKTKTWVTVCGGTGCQAYGCQKVVKAFQEEIKRLGLGDSVGVRTTGCHGFCERGPLVVIQPEGIFYQRVSVEDVPEIINETVVNKKIVERLLYKDPQTGQKIIHEHDVPFYSKQKRIIFGNNGLIDPTDIRDYIAVDGYQALSKVLFEMTAEEVIEEIKKSGLRGRGGAGFLTGLKWEICRRVSSPVKYLICNADEGDPGAYMDRSLLEGNPHSVIEGMVIGAYAIGATEGFIYVRLEYPLAVKNITLAIEQAREFGFLGDSILGSEFSFDLHVFKGAGAFVSGEETSLMASIEGRRAFPRQKPPFPAQKGLWGRPTNINNVETWANVPLIIKKGADWYSQIGTRTSKGTKIFSLVGKINNTGLVEVPMGITLREIIYDIGGGIKDNKKFKAVQTGGPSGGCIPAEMLDLPIDFDTLTKAGSMMGSGGMIVMDEDTCMVDVARYFLQFTQEESCGKCVPCRLGTRQLYEILTRITKGEGEEEDLKRLEDLAKTIKAGSLCGLGQTAPNPVLTTLKYFRHEYEAHIKRKECPALSCKDLIIYYIEPDKCVGCLLCLKNCPVGAISGERKKVHVINQDLCVKCGACYEVCPPKIRAVSKYTGRKKEAILKKEKQSKE
ncbi:MAG: NADH-quinone oxidoreductase subunit NuoF [Candidatus Aminicenantes bacterium]|mgnify:FL=1|nr:MAG: NADH-quinone oxidoreductase subunit NuoF [Candidatus Aminicenantes bacterium]HHF42572.1 NADH-quinone oxidoreductase subunit NuoF [Candidatus Aminicenantes bacterium]